MTCNLLAKSDLYLSMKVSLRISDRAIQTSQSCPPAEARVHLTLLKPVLPHMKPVSHGPWLFALPLRLTLT